MSKGAKQPSAFQWKPLAEFLCRHHGVSDVHHIVPFGQRIPAWDVMREVTVGLESSWPGGTRVLGKAQPSKPFVNPRTQEPMPVDLESVCVYKIVCRHSKSTYPGDVAVRLNYYHSSMAELQQTPQHDKIIEAAGGVRGAFAKIGPSDGTDMDASPMHELGFAFQNGPFCHTMTLIDETNLMNGIVLIPHEVCLAAALPVYKGVPEPEEALIESMMRSMNLAGAEAREALISEQKADFVQRTQGMDPITHFYAVPINHVLAWGYHSEDFAKQHNHRAEQFRFVPPPDAGVGSDPVLLYYLVGNTFFAHTLEAFRRDWLGKIDRRPLSQVGFEFIPLAKNAVATGDVTMRSYATFYGAPRLAPGTIAGLAPALAPGFPSCHDWSPDAVSQQLAMEQAAATKGRRLRE